MPDDCHSCHVVQDEDDSYVDSAPDAAWDVQEFGPLLPLHGDMDGEPLGAIASQAVEDQPNAEPTVAELRHQHTHPRPWPWPLPPLPAPAATMTPTVSRSVVAAEAEGPDLNEEEDTWLAALLL